VAVSHPIVTLKSKIQRPRFRSFHSVRSLRSSITEPTTPTQSFRTAFAMPKAPMAFTLWLEVAVALPSDVVNVEKVIAQNTRDAAFRDENQILVEHLRTELPACREL
jgi:hypothetical protein